MKIIEINQQKIIKSKRLLKEIILNPAKFSHDEKLFKALKSQGGFAKLEITKNEIPSCSLNTMKAASERLLERGFDEIDELRKNAKSSIERVRAGSKKNVRTQTGLRNKLDDLEKKNLILMNRHSEMRNIVSLLQAELKKIVFMEAESQRLAQYDFIMKKTNEMLMIGVHEEG